MLCRLEALYRTAFAQKKLSVCVAVLGQIADMQGLTKNVISVEHSRTEFGIGRSEQDLEHYALTGNWLTDNSPAVMLTAGLSAAQVPTEYTAADPLARLLREETH
jgi:hypothetical protein